MTASTLETAAPEHLDDNAIVAERRSKLSKLRERGNAFPNDFRREDFAQDLHDRYGELSKEDLAEANIDVAVAGRMVLKRVMGKASFATVQDMSGRLQFYITNDHVGETIHGEFKHWDLGDIIAARGQLFKTNKGELSIQVRELRLLAKSLRPLPEKFHGLTDIEAKYRQRYLDLIVTEESRKTFIARSKIIQEVRAFFVDRGYLEVETPMMHPIPGGAAAKPFVTHHNALDAQMFLRVAPELYLKRLVVGGFEKVFEINRNFRNEGMSVRHNPEFTMLEFYETYQDFRYMMDLTEALLKQVAQKVVGTTQLTYQGKTVDFDKPFDRLTMPEAVNKYCPQYALSDLASKSWLIEKLSTMKLNLKGRQLTDLALGELQLIMFEETTEALLWQPTFIVDYPWEISPLARRNNDNPEITDRFELFITGREIANGFSELNDPEDQAERFMQQVSVKDAGDDEAMHYDADYIRALEYGMPPTAGEGIGIDRLVMLLTDSAAIRDVILFPQMKREG